MARKELLREELDDKRLPGDRRTNQVKGEIDVADLDSDDLRNLRDEDITNLSENDLSQLESELGVTQGTDDTSNILPIKKLNRDLEDEERARIDSEDEE